MTSSQLKLSRSEGVLAALAALLLVALFTIRWGATEDQRKREEMQAQVVSARKAMELAKQDAETAPLEAEKRQLREAMAKFAVPQVDGGAVLLNMWTWAANSRVQMQVAESRSELSKVGTVNVIAYHYNLALRGEAANLHQFLTLATSQPYRSSVAALSVKRGRVEGQWDMSLSLVVYAAQS